MDIYIGWEEGRELRTGAKEETIPIECLDQMLERRGFVEAAMKLRLREGGAEAETAAAAAAAATSGGGAGVEAGGDLAAEAGDLDGLAGLVVGGAPAGEVEFGPGPLPAADARWATPVATAPTTFIRPGGDTRVFAQLHKITEADPEDM